MCASILLITSSEQYVVVSGVDQIVAEYVSHFMTHMLFGSFYGMDSVMQTF